MGFVDEGTILNNYAHVFDLLLRLRQAVDHPFLVLYAKERHSIGTLFLRISYPFVHTFNLIIHGLILN